MELMFDARSALIWVFCLGFILVVLVEFCQVIVSLLIIRSRHHARRRDLNRRFGANAKYLR